jgi:Zn-dependent membrane protease YugP
MLQYFLMMLPAILLAFWAQARVRRTYHEASQVRANLSGAAAARYILDSAGLGSVEIEPVQGMLSDHYDPRSRSLRLSTAVYSGTNQAAVGIAAHEAGHAIQHAMNYAPLAVRNAAVPAAQFGSNAAFGLILFGSLMQLLPVLLLGIACFSAVVFFQLVNLPVEFDASSRAKKQLVELGIVPASQMTYVNRVLNAAALTYVAATLTAVLELLYYVMRFTSRE